MNACKITVKTVVSTPSSSKSDNKTYDKFKTTFNVASSRLVQKPDFIRFSELVNYIDLKTIRGGYNKVFAELNKEFDAEIDHSSTAAEEYTSDTGGRSSNTFPETKDETICIQKTLYEDVYNKALQPIQKGVFRRKLHSNLDVLRKTWDSVYGTLSKDHSLFRIIDTHTHIIRPFFSAIYLSPSSPSASHDGSYGTFNPIPSSQSKFPPISPTHVTFPMKVLLIFDLVHLHPQNVGLDYEIEQHVLNGMLVAVWEAHWRTIFDDVPFAPANVSASVNT
ncbi:hypothetical protein PHYBLDRAFT_149884 [Phycomyces blakesleeanus NRRL 1555(-)]|uniref:Uncharacterized protein n=1 Tax=Phycomyces blakesleeanus (strain ATCC 8743b / DSM 1359 / FGSC 10004 / NBRC 33097 / NRRL 1555) TaxID=763407 RepID=A0A167KU08_PHYB8|nr:hypothetical protein PHYBLDRAFT_149884 [Phycomyces blakesleeanus NRRL 1555(-)]OAD68879.1 hypothetical protein PHYBLDRAFT_149884 [Phycomyces blakesleeanus NRRL 1555(-)]|eukprot:XP_018286919.1 hypothetical protein PHYBLDRAFT_149884 [Phycomyces blakesleeanus NRRL 1555(-)]